ncbi:MAG: hypothetical protein OXH64_09310 [Rhodospirillaceae bacterium]|nr:hypothetical protein [Rhodospirillaceae bacterium]
MYGPDLQDRLKAWASGLVGGDVAVEIGRSEALPRQMGGRFVSIGTPEADLEVGQFGSGDNRYNVVWSIPIDVSSFGSEYDPRSAYGSSYELLQLLMNSVADDDLQLPATNWTTIDGYSTKTEYTDETKAMVLTLNLSVNTIGWNSSDSA